MNAHVPPPVAAPSPEAVAVMYAIRLEHIGELLGLIEEAEAIDARFRGACVTSSDPADSFDRLVEEAVKRNAAKREAIARALWRNAETRELRAHLRLIYPDLFKDIRDPPPRRWPIVPPGPDYPPGFHDWPLEQRKGWYAEFNEDRIRRERGAAERLSPTLTLGEPPFSPALRPSPTGTAHGSRIDTKSLPKTRPASTSLRLR
jgi:hypothetical protein